MKIIDLLSAGSIKLNVSAKSKNEVIDMLVQLHQKSGNLSDADDYKRMILEREAQSTTSIGEGIAVPHAKSESVKRPALAALTLSEGVDYGAPDGKPSNLLFMIAAPLDGDVHLEILSRLMVMLMEPEFCSRLRSAASAEEFLKIIDDKEKEKYPETPNEEVSKKESDGGAYRILAVTACPTGIAHTYMAAEALEKAAAGMGYTIKVETNGSGGTKNALTKAEIADCDGIIVAADKNVEMARFAGRPVLKTSVSSGINKPEELINAIIDGKAAVYEPEDGETDSSYSDEKESFGRRIYKHLMNGVSHMLPFVVGGGVLIALGFLIDTIAGNAKAGGNFGFTNPVAAVVFWIGKAAFALMLPILAGYIASSIADRPGLLPGIVGGVFAANGYTFASLIDGKDLVGDSGAVSGFLGALLAGFVAGILVNLLKKAFKWMPKSMDGIKPVFIYPLLGTFLIGLFMLAVNPAIGWLNTALSEFLKSLGASSKIVLSIVLAAMMAIDMGGPFNKAAYVFGTAAIVDGNTWIMAAVMIGGMVPPIAIALSTTFNKNRWNNEELKSGPVNYLMGLCFITEGAIPYAAADPLRVIPSCMVGSGVAGALSALLGCECPAPHGGIFVFAVVTHPLYYILALVAGSAAGALMLALLKKNRNKKKETA